MAVCLCLQHQPLFSLSDLLDGGQIDLALLQGAGIYVVEQRGDQALRRLSAVLRREDHPTHRAGEPGWPGVERAGGPQAPCPLWGCLLYTSDAADERSSVDLGGRRIIK